MPPLTISQVARRIRLRPSAIRYYERIGLLPPAVRVSGQRRYDQSVLYHLAIIQRARQLGFTLAEIRCLFFGFRDTARASERWRTLSQRKLAELQNLMRAIQTVRALLKKLITKCRCDTLDQCGKKIFQNMNHDVLGICASSDEGSRRYGAESAIRHSQGQVRQKALRKNKLRRA